MKLFEFIPPDNPCFYYVVKADNMDQAIEKFLKWEDENLDLELKWSEEIVKDPDNWTGSPSVILIE